MIAEKTRVEIEQACPDCNGMLKVVEQVNENGVSFVWYKCARADCSGQWLERRVAAIKDY
jgi:uncharacterized protein YbaR (Trm112 family)